MPQSRSSLVSLHETGTARNRDRFILALALTRNGDRNGDRSICGDVTGTDLFGPISAVRAAANPKR